VKGERRKGKGLKKKKEERRINGTGERGVWGKKRKRGEGLREGENEKRRTEKRIRELMRKGENRECERREEAKMRGTGRKEKRMRE
jgi:hypothetical protein